MNKRFFAAALGAAVVSTQATAQGAALPQAGGTQQDMTRDQAKQFADSTFQRLDLNHDGTVTKEEADQAIARAGGHGHMLQRAFATAKSLTLGQFEASSLAQFDAVDANHDGIVTAAEREQARALRAKKQGQ